jgi:hypothetical protein
MFTRNIGTNQQTEGTVVFRVTRLGTDVRIKKKYFGEKFSEKIGVFDTKQRYINYAKF